MPDGDYNKLKHVAGFFCGIRVSCLTVYIVCISVILYTVECIGKQNIYSAKCVHTMISQLLLVSFSLEIASELQWG